MTISKGQVWGVVAPLPSGAAVVNSDAALAEQLGNGVRSGVPAIVGLTGGAIWELLGGASLAGRIHTPNAYTFPIDLGVVSGPGIVETSFVNHVVAHSRSWRKGVAVLNGQVVAGLRLGHRSHVNDGALDLTSWSLRLQELRAVRSRAAVGAHTPHPRIEEHRVRSFEVVLGRRLRIEADGVGIGEASSFDVRVVPDAGFVVV